MGSESVLICDSNQVDADLTALDISGIWSSDFSEPKILEKLFSDVKFDWAETFLF